MKKVIEINANDAAFLSDYKKSHGVLPATFIDMAIRERIVKIKAEIKLINDVSNQR